MMLGTFPKTTFPNSNFHKCQLPQLPTSPTATSPTTISPSSKIYNFPNVKKLIFNFAYHVTRVYSLYFYPV